MRQPSDRARGSGGPSDLIAQFLDSASERHTVDAEQVERRGNQARIRFAVVRSAFGCLAIGTDGMHRYVREIRVYGPILCCLLSLPD